MSGKENKKSSNPRQMFDNTIDETKNAPAPRRQADAAPTVWNALNILQENLIKGGTSRTGSTGRTQRTRAVVNIDADVKINTSLWSLAEKLAHLEKSGSL